MGSGSSPGGDAIRSEKKSVRETLCSRSTTSVDRLSLCVVGAASSQDARRMTGPGSSPEIGRSMIVQAAFVFDMDGTLVDR